MMTNKIIKQEKNPFFSREEFVIEITSDTNPTEEFVKSIIGKDENLTIIKKLGNHFGKKIFIAEALVYDSQEAKDKIETIPKKVRKKMAEEEKAAQEAAAKKIEEEKKAAQEAKQAAEAAKTEAVAAEETPKAEENKSEDTPKE